MKEEQFTLEEQVFRFEKEETSWRLDLKRSEVAYSAIQKNSHSLLFVGCSQVTEVNLPLGRAVWKNSFFLFFNWIDFIP